MATVLSWVGLSVAKTLETCVAFYARSRGIYDSPCENKMSNFWKVLRDVKPHYTSPVHNKIHEC